MELQQEQGLLTGFLWRCESVPRPAKPPRIRAAVALGLLLLLFSIYVWASLQKAARVAAEAKAKAAQERLVKANEEVEQANAALAQIRAHVAETERIMEAREQQRETTQEAMRAASWTISQLRRDNAELRAWLDRPIPADVRRVLDHATRGGKGGEATASITAAR